ncbi:MAG: 2-oxoacid:acceptor oxidoreductase family protein [Oscillospiraceae bacterium]|nr:2-oxoacid:acceptor oxidoreductase family protein [Oscillospiraceae bacterium]
MIDCGILFAGFGGQGVLFTGKVMAYVGLILGKEVSWMPSYGPEMRGGTANCGVCISDKPVGSPVVVEPDTLVAMNGPAYDKFVDAVKPGGIVLYDSSIVHPEKIRDDVKTCSLPATALSAEKGLSGLANMVLLGRLFKEMAWGEIETLKTALKESIPPARQHMIERNLLAFKLGFAGN